jgi:hypothetical protein
MPEPGARVLYVQWPSVGYRVSEVIDNLFQGKFTSRVMPVTIFRWMRITASHMLLDRN